MSLEVREDSTYTFSHEKIVSNVPTLIESATARILDRNGSVLQASTTMDLSGSAVNIASLTVDFSDDPSTSLTYARARNYRIEMTIDNVIYNYFFDIVRYPFVNLVTDQDLIDENSMLADGIAEEEGDATDGSSTSIIDTNRLESDDFWNGGKVTIFPIEDTGSIEERLITNFIKDTGTIVFDPAITTPVTTEHYLLRKSYQSLITRAGNIVKDDIASAKEKAYLMIDSSQVNRLIIYKALEKYLIPIRKEKDDQYDIMIQEYREQYNKLFLSIPLIFDQDDSGSISDDEAKGSNFSVINLSR